MTYGHGSRVAGPKGRAGFTLIEALLATLLMAIIMGALAQMTSQWLRSWAARRLA